LYTNTYLLKIVPRPLGTIRYNWYNLKMKVDYQGLFKQKYYYRYVPTVI